MQDIITMINTVGFPIFVAVWMLIKDQKEKRQTREALAMLTTAIDKLVENLKINLLCKKEDEK